MKPVSSQAHDQALQNGGSFTDSNNRWKIQITGKGGSGADAYVDVQVTDLLSPQITSQPVADQNATAGGSVTFNVTASGSSLTYQWQKQDANGTWVNINGANCREPHFIKLNHWKCGQVSGRDHQ